MSGLEAGSLDVFPRVDSGATISDAQARTGNYSLRISTADDRAWVALRDGYTELFLRIGLYMTGGYSASDHTFCTLLDVGGNELLTFQVRDADSVLLVRLGGWSGALLDSGGTVPTDTWCCIEIRALISNAAGIVQVRIDGVQIIAFSGDTQVGANDEIWAVPWGASPVILGRYVCYGYYDDLAVNDISGSRNNGWIGQGGIVGLVPTGAGNYTWLTPSTGVNWQCISEVPPDDDTTYVEDAVVGQKDTYGMQNLVITPGYTANISTVQWVCRALNTVSQSRGLARLLRIAAVDYQGDDIGCDRSFDYHLEVIETNPATGEVWTEAEINALEAGMVVR